VEVPTFDPRMALLSARKSTRLRDRRPTARQGPPRQLSAPSQSQALLGLCICVTYDLAHEVHGSFARGKVPTSRISEPRSDAHGLGAEVSRDPHQNRSV
jgi:hypothetical protein